MLRAKQSHHALLTGTLHDWRAAKSVLGRSGLQKRGVRGERVNDTFEWKTGAARYPNGLARSGMQVPYFARTRSLSLW